MIRRSDTRSTREPISCSADRAEVGCWSRRPGGRLLPCSAPSPPYSPEDEDREDPDADDDQRGDAQQVRQVQVEAGLPEPDEELAQLVEQPRPGQGGVGHRDENGVDGVPVGAAFAALLGFRPSRSFRNLALVDAGHHEARERESECRTLHDPVCAGDVQDDDPESTRGERSEAAQSPSEQGAGHEGQHRNSDGDQHGADLLSVGGGGGVGGEGVLEPGPELGLRRRAGARTVRRGRRRGATGRGCERFQVDGHGAVLAGFRDSLRQFAGLLVVDHVEVENVGVVVEDGPERLVDELHPRLVGLLEGRDLVVQSADFLGRTLVVETDVPRVVLGEEGPLEAELGRLGDVRGRLEYLQSVLVVHAVELGQRLAGGDRTHRGEARDLVIVCEGTVLDELGDLVAEPPRERGELLDLLLGQFGGCSVAVVGVVHHRRLQVERVERGRKRAVAPLSRSGYGGGVGSSLRHGSVLLDMSRLHRFDGCRGG